ncbi:hypothetical protein AHMF7605_26115 [Adhaeribacter arboris]|uniref:Tail specific protease domain-containing protein n=1 Tax=Adhaeribacter arboris TaxID=2072846 RepID=A0A2T2YMJ1_9BACT|nr:S41 family peptidase [Adhaeribacter arboris]PSR56721.1 hypothetical protein AHMF7605_26115 [Adhaeribacter arboris]
MLAAVLSVIWVMMLPQLPYRKLLLFGLFFWQLGCFSQSSNPALPLLPRAALRHDFDILRQTLQEAHPGFYWYSRKDSLDRFWDHQRTFINQDMTRLEFFKLLLPLIAQVKCVHTRLQLPANLITNPFTSLLPFDFLCQNGRLFIRRNWNGEAYVGAEVLAINHVETKHILRTLLGSIPADGDNETFKFQRLSQGAFREGYALFYGQPEHFTIQVRDSTQPQAYSFPVQALSPKRLVANQTYPSPFLLHFRQNTAVLAVNTFEGNTAQFQDSVATLFQKIQAKGAKHLIMDLRQNGGGANDNVSTLYSYIAAAPFRHLRKAERNATELTYRQFIANAESFRKRTDIPVSEGKYLVNDQYAGTSWKKPADQTGFRGDVVLLIFGQTTSAAAEFAALAHYLKRATIVGEETGGGYYGATGGSYLTLKLPHSGLEVRIPTIRIFMAVAEDYEHQPKGRGTLPDYPVEPTIAEVLSGKDIPLEKALNLLHP